jgi:molecular chaperone GrpE
MSPEKTEEDRADENIVDEADADTQDENDVQEETDINPVMRLEAENAELREKLLRMAAENQNTRKRLVKQQQDAHKYRHQDILRDLAEVIDNFERAIVSSTDSRDFDTFHEGILMIEKQFSGMLAERYGLERIGVEGEPFDPAAHEAMMMEESPDVESESVKQVYQAGYRLHDRVLRPAKVVIWKPTQTEDAGDGDNEESK